MSDVTPPAWKFAAATSVSQAFSRVERITVRASALCYGTILVLIESRRFLNEFTPAKTNKEIHVDQATRRAQVLFVEYLDGTAGSFAPAIGSTPCFVE